MRTVEIHPDAVLQAATAIPKDQPVVMINLLRFRDRADYGERTDVLPCSGREAFYERYSRLASPLGQADGINLLWSGTVLSSVVAPPEERWDDLLLVQYPSFSSLQRLLANPEYKAVLFHRTAALEDSRLIASATNMGMGGFEVPAASER